MKQYLSIKGKYPDAVLLFRVGDFYETFGEDAIRASKVLGIVLTKRQNGAASHIELAGFPHHSLETYLPKLVRAGFRVAICDQLEDPKLTKKIVKRGVTEVVTPGVAYSDNILDNQSNNFLASVFYGKKNLGVSFLDVSTGEFLVAEGTVEYIGKLLQSLNPSEVVFERTQKQRLLQDFGDSFYIYALEEWVYQYDFAYELLTKHFQTNSLKGFGIQQYENAIIAAGAAMHYISETQNDKIKHISSIQRIAEENYVWLDRFTIRNLEIFQSNSPNGIALIDILNGTITPMGARLLKRWLTLPLKNQTAINERLNCVAFLLDHKETGNTIGTHLKQFADIERLVSKVSIGKITPRELIQLNKSLIEVHPIKKLCEETKNNQLQKIGEQLNACTALTEKITATINEDAPVLLAKGGVIKAGVSAELDEYRALKSSGNNYLNAMKEREMASTKIPSLKIGFNNVFGYYIEVTNTHKDKVPETWIRKQTLVNCERYITEELKEYETKILSAEEKISALEATLYNQLVFEVSEYMQPIQYNAALIAQLDCLLNFSQLAAKNRYYKPQFSEDGSLKITNGRHPVIETTLPLGEKYIENSIELNQESQQIIMITGPNMSGKSAILRQTALISLLAQIGSFVPAEAAHLSIVDKIFTRVGASDNISQGESTFMVEMNETASILNNLSENSLVILDEIGRGTSTYDGISIAWAITEYLHEHPTKPKTLFATHYHELNDMTQTFERIKNYNVSIQETKNKIIFLRKLIPGGSEHSFGIHVAKMAGMPSTLISKANSILKKLESSHSTERNKHEIAQAVEENNMQLSIFQLDDPTLFQVKEQLQSIDINTLTPVEALMKLNEIKKIIGSK